MRIDNLMKYLTLWCFVSSLCLYGEDGNLTKLVEQEVKGAAAKNQSSFKKESNESKKESEVLSNTPAQQKQESQAVIDNTDATQEESQIVNNGTESQPINVNTEQEKKETSIVDKEIKNIVSDCEETPKATSSKVAEPSEDQTKERTGFVYNYDKVKTKEITPYAGPCARRAVDVYFEGDYIYWNAREEGLEYAADGFIQISNTSFYSLIAAGTYKLPQGNIYAPDFKTKSGYKAGAGLDFSYDGWNVVAVYTKLTSSAHSQVANVMGLIPGCTTGFVVRDNNVFFGGFAGTADAIFSIRSASSDWHLNFNVLDAVLAREYFISSKLVLKPNLGMKFTMQKQSYNIFYDHSGELNNFPVSGEVVLEVDATTPTVVPVGTTRILNIALAGETTSIYSTQHYWGFGPKIGSNLSWLFSKNFSLFGEGAVSTLWGRFKDGRQDIDRIVDVNTDAVLVDDFTDINILNTIHALNAVLELQIGLRCDIWASKGDFRFRMQAGWENQIWFSQNHFSDIDTRPGVGNLVLQGLTAQLSFDF